SAQHHVGDIANAYRHAARCADHDVADVLDAADLPGRADQVLLAAAFDIAGADVGIVAFERLNEIGQRKPARDEAIGIGGDLELFGIPADGVDLGHSGNIAQLWLDDPVLDLAQVHRRVRRAVRFLRTILRFNSPHVDFAETGRDGP